MKFWSKFWSFLPAAFAVAALAFGITSRATAFDDPSLLSEANQALFTTNHLESITQPVKLMYSFEKSGTLGESFTGRVVVNVTKVLPSGRKNLSFRFLSGKRKVRFPPLKGYKSNPIFMLFLERDAQELRRMTGGNALYFRNRIRYALAGSAEVSPTTFTFNGRTMNGTEIRVQPYLKAGLRKRFLQFIQRTYVFIISNEIPGGFYQISSITPGGSGDGVLNRESLTFVKVEERKKKKKKD